jgi:hypothetical protein
MVYFTLEILTEGLNMYQKASTYDRRGAPEFDSFDELFKMFHSP